MPPGPAPVSEEKDELQVAPSLAGKLLLTLFLSSFVLVGALFTVSLFLQTCFSLWSYTWPRVPCTILTSAVDEHPGPNGGATTYVFRVRYRYIYGGAAHLGQRYRPGYDGSSDIGDARHLADKYAPATSARCFVDPTQPERSMLARPTLWSALFILAALLVTAAVGIPLLYVWSPPAARSVLGWLGRGSAAGRPGWLPAFFALFMIAGAATFGLFAVPAVQAWKARSWQATPCVLLESGLHTYTDRDDNTRTYSIEVLYTYKVNGREYRSNRYEFLGGGSGNRAAQERIVKSLPPGTGTVCYVDSDDPSQAVVERGLTGAYAFALVPLLFLGVGLAGMIYTWSGGFGRRTDTT